MNNLFDGKRIMIVVAHPDDELLGLGATMHNLIENHKATSHVVILGEGITSRSENRDAKKWGNELARHHKNSEIAQRAIGYHTAKSYSLADNRFDSVNLLDIVKIVELEKKNFKPDVIFTHHGGDLNIDHRLTFQAVLTACRPMAEEKVKTIVCFETPSGTEWQASSHPFQFVPNLFFEIREEDLRAKIEGMQAYEFERREFPHPRSPEALRILAQRWGVANGCALAEAFYLVRSVLRISTYQ